MKGGVDKPRLARSRSRNTHKRHASKLTSGPMYGRARLKVAFTWARLHAANNMRWSKTNRLLTVPYAQRRYAVYSQVIDTLNSQGQHDYDYCGMLAHTSSLLPEKCTDYYAKEAQYALAEITKVVLKFEAPHTPAFHFDAGRHVHYRLKHSEAIIAAFLLVGILLSKRQRRDTP